MPIQTFEIQCQQCQQIETFKAGHDDVENSIEKAVPHLQGKTQIQVKSIIRKHQIDQAVYGYAAFSCPDCHTIYNHYSVKVEYDNIMLFQPFHKCPNCNNTLLKISTLPKTHICQQCAD
jgi:DNA replicative helicase MCM subunit Mcm2 (Cdc46/Mcm family)